MKKQNIMYFILMQFFSFYIMFVFHWIMLLSMKKVYNVDCVRNKQDILSFLLHLFPRTDFQNKVILNPSKHNKCWPNWGVYRASIHHIHILHLWSSIHLQHCSLLSNSPAVCFGGLEKSAKHVLTDSKLGWRRSCYRLPIHSLVKIGSTEIIRSPFVKHKVFVWGFKRREENPWEHCEGRI